MARRAEASVLNQIVELQRMTNKQLHEKWKELVGSEAAHLSRNYLIRRLAYRIQELAYGPVSKQARKRIASSLEEEPRCDARSEKTNLAVGTRLVRQWHGERYEVIVQEDGFLFDGKTYRSLSAVARAITGRHCGGRRFFGLQPGRKKRRETGDRRREEERQTKCRQ